MWAFKSRAGEPINWVAKQSLDMNDFIGLIIKKIVFFKKKIESTAIQQPFRTHAMKLAPKVGPHVLLDPERCSSETRDAMAAAQVLAAKNLFERLGLPEALVDVATVRSQYRTGFFKIGGTIPI